MNYYSKKVAVFNIPALIYVSVILWDCGADMYKKYQLTHWKNSFFKTFLIVMYTALKNCVWGVYEDKKIIATFQTKIQNKRLHFGKLAVSPKISGKGVGSYCLTEMEKMAKCQGLTSLTCEVYEKSKHAYDFYIKRGFTVVGEMKTLNYKELILEKRL